MQAPFECSLVNPVNVTLIVAAELILSLFLPDHLINVCNAMFRESGSVSDGAHLVLDLLGKLLQGAFIASSLDRTDDSDLPIKAFSASID